MRRWILVVAGLVVAGAIAFAILMPSRFTCAEGSLLFTQRGHSTGEVIHGCREPQSDGFQLGHAMDAESDARLPLRAVAIGVGVLGGALLMLVEHGRAHSPVVA